MTLKTKLQLSSGKKFRYSEVLDDLKRVREISPLSFFHPYGLQNNFLTSISKKILLCGGNRSGKTEAIAAKVLKRCKKKKQKWWIVGETFQDSIAIQQSKIWALVPKDQIKYGKYNVINGFTNRKLLLKNGSLISFKSYDQDRESFQGDQVDGVWFDEECPYDIYQECKMRLIDRDGELFISMTSLKGVTDLVQEIYADSDIDKLEYAPLVNEVLPRIATKNEFDIFFLWSTENKYIPQHRVTQEAKLMTRDEIKSRIYGLPINLSGKIYMMFNSNIHVTPFENLPFTQNTLYHVLDPHDRKPWAMIWALVNITGKCYIIDEYPERNFNEMLYDDKTYDDYAKIIKEKEEGIKRIFGKSVHRRIIDPNYGHTTVKLAERQGGQSHTTPIKELRKRGLNFKDGIDALEAGHLEVRKWLYYDTKNDEIVVQPQLLIADNCQNTIRHLSRYSRKDILTSDGDVRDKVGVKEKFKDYSDLCRYLLMSNPKYIAPSKDFRSSTPKIY